MKKETKQKIKEILKKVVMFILNPRLLLCFGIAWMITNGWSYVMLALGAYFKISWMTALAAGYLALMWVPGTPEKIITVAIAIFLLRVLFPKDEKTLGILREWHARFISAVRSRKRKRKNKKENADNENNNVKENEK